jgi:hypothetical protein
MDLEGTGMSRRIANDPVVLSLVPCQRAARDETTGRWDISGTISGIIAGEFPAAVILVVYIAIRRGDLDRQQINIAALSPTGAIVGSAILEVTWTTDEIAELSVAIPLQFATPGTYTLRLFTQDRILIERPIEAKAE